MMKGPGRTSPVHVGNAPSTSVPAHVLSFFAMHKNYPKRTRRDLFRQSFTQIQSLHDTRVASLSFFAVLAIASNTEMFYPRPSFCVPMWAYGHPHSAYMPQLFMRSAVPEVPSPTACCRDVASLKAALTTCRLEDVLSLLCTAPIQLGSAGYTTLITACGKRGDLAKARAVFEAVPTPNVWHVSALISAYANAGDWMSAVKVLKHSASDGIEPNTITYSTTIEACARTGHLDVAVEVFREMLDAGVQPDTVTYAILLTHFSRRLEWTHVAGLLEEMHGKGLAARTPIYAAFIRHLCTAGDWNRALSLYLVMTDLGAQVTGAIYWELIQALSAAGKPRMIAQLLSEAAAADIPDCRDLFEASLTSLLASGFDSQAKTLHILMVDQGWEPSPAYSASTPEPQADVFQWEGACTAAPSLRSIDEGNRPQTSSSTCSCSSCCCTEGDVCSELPPAAIEAGRGRGSTTKVPQAVRSSQAAAVAPHGREASQTSPSTPAPTSSQAGSFTFSSFCSAGTDSTWATSFSDSSGSDLAGRAHSVMSSASLRVMSSPARSLLSCTSAELLPHAADCCGTAAELHTAPADDTGPPAQAAHKEASLADSAAAAAASCTTAGMCGPFYAYIPTCGPAGMVYTVAGPYYQDATHPDRWFAVAFGGSSVAC